MAFATRRDGKMLTIKCCGSRYAVMKGRWIDCPKCGAAITHEPLMTNKEPVADVLCNVGLSCETIKENRTGCKICGRKLELRESVCFDCAEFESLIMTGLNMYDNPVERELDNTEAMNILYQIMKRYGVIKAR
jgi:hypothetical protein